MSRLNAAWIREIDPVFERHRIPSQKLRIECILFGKLMVDALGGCWSTARMEEHLKELPETPVEYYRRFHERMETLSLPPARTDDSSTEEQLYLSYLTFHPARFPCGPSEYPCRVAGSRLFIRREGRWLDVTEDPVDCHPLLVYAVKYWDKHLDDVQSLWVEAQFSFFSRPNEGNGFNTSVRRVFPSWFARARTGPHQRFWTDYRRFLHEWIYFLSVVGKSHAKYCLRVPRPMRSNKTPSGHVCHNEYRKHEVPQARGTASDVTAAVIYLHRTATACHNNSESNRQHFQYCVVRNPRIFDKVWIEKQNGGSQHRRTLAQTRHASCAFQIDDGGESERTSERVIAIPRVEGNIQGMQL
ncbi:hypothetical protein DFJ58DRAFT_846237 [Suillus subalutaceus]|uniref:uncharacterized protein n=1 Tax=Suillus subalutaceus TaxID=48586 RepID=UPI001B867266|nr:uncharacterized protein DFJ58DRAFT_846237 [Suillus subalutaceus]KAG1838033.1 hypothetical protein DFJ58DRAFT_846237 [Suillus subalutaceus]